MGSEEEGWLSLSQTSAQAPALRFFQRVEQQRSFCREFLRL